MLLLSTSPARFPLTGDTVLSHRRPSPLYMDERPLLQAGTPEFREYRMRFWDKGPPNGDWTDVVKVTVSP
ncbi:hypothetical protein [Prosthecobacter sp.]